MKKIHSDDMGFFSWHKSLLLTAILSTVLLLSGCTIKIENVRDANIETNQGVVDKTKDNGSKDPTTPVESDVSQDNTPDTAEDIADVSQDDTPAVSQGNSEDSADLFSELSEYQFVFASGVGAWQTMLNINADGTFAGEFYDSDMGDIGEDYPNGIVYSSTFKGKFTEPKVVNGYTYSVLIETLTLEEEPETEEIVDGIKFIYSDPYGIDDAKDILIYTPKAPVKDLPEGFRNWVGFYDPEEIKDEQLGYYGLYNVETESGFSSYKLHEED